MPPENIVTKSTSIPLPPAATPEIVPVLVIPPAKFVTFTTAIPLPLLSAVPFDRITPEFRIDPVYIPFWTEMPVGPPGMIVPALTVLPVTVRLLNRIQLIVVLAGLLKPDVVPAAQAARAGPEPAAIIATTELVASSPPTIDLDVFIPGSPSRGSHCYGPVRVAAGLQRRSYVGDEQSGEQGLTRLHNHW
jgi:hypothetical protein